MGCTRHQGLERCGPLGTGWDRWGWELGSEAGEWGEESRESRVLLQSLEKGVGLPLENRATLEWGNQCRGERTNSSRILTKRSRVRRAQSALNSYVLNEIKEGMAHELHPDRQKTSSMGSWLRTDARILQCMSPYLRISGQCLETVFHKYRRVIWSLRLLGWGWLWWRGTGVNRLIWLWKTGSRGHKPTDCLFPYSPGSPPYLGALEPSLKSWVSLRSSGTSVVVVSVHSNLSPSSPRHWALDAAVCDIAYGFYIFPSLLPSIR